MKQPLEWSVEFFVDARGRMPAFEFIQSLQPKEQAAMFRVLDLLQARGIALGLPYARPVEEFWELRAGAGRLFYVAYTGRRFIVLHGYYKKTRKTPRREIETARRRWAQFLENER